ncbi:MAG: zf-HC2 domain-containing protein [Sedimentisphaerales bacterium]|nr:zf-HC2 domain-containing protein [Sedimentisphaerales bacterium]
MKKTCEGIEQMLVDYVDGQLSPADSNKVAEHLAKCANCQRLHNTLQKSLELAGIIWADSLTETENIRNPVIKTRKIRWIRYTAIAASILLVATASVVWHTLSRPKDRELTFAEIERRINESGSAAQLLAATELLNDNPRTENIIKQQYQYIVERYPETSSAIKAKSKMQ